MSNQQVVKSSIEKEWDSDLPKVIEEGNIQQLKAAAQYFLNQVRKYYEITIHSQGLIEKSSFLNGRQILYEYMRTSTNFTRQLAQLQHYFEVQLDNFLGRKIYLSWVNQMTGTIIYLDEFEIAQLYKKGRRYSYLDKKTGKMKGGGAESIKDTSVLSTARAFSKDENDKTKFDIFTDIVTKTSLMDEQLKEKLKKSQDKRRYVYQEAIARYKTKNSGGRFWWRPSNQRKRTYTRVFEGTGRIAEGYVDAVVNEDENVEAYPMSDGVKNDPLENSLKFLYLNHIEIESIPGIIKGDVVMNSDNNIQFAVKTGDFKTAKFSPAYVVATAIANGSFSSVEEIKNNLSEIIDTDQVALSILQNIYTEVEKQIETQLKEIIN